MADKYEIERVISTGRKGQQITVRFQGQSITRHTRNGMGRHPDNNLPVLHRNLETRLEEAKVGKRHAEEAIQMLQKNKVQGWQDHILDLQSKIALINESIPLLQSSLDLVRREDPLTVHYV